MCVKDGVGIGQSIGVTVFIQEVMRPFTRVPPQGMEISVLR
jgi:hypothetical protein